MIAIESYLREPSALGRGSGRLAAFAKPRKQRKDKGKKRGGRGRTALKVAAGVAGVGALGLGAKMLLDRKRKKGSDAGKETEVRYLPSNNKEAKRDGAIQDYSNEQSRNLIESGRTRTKNGVQGRYALSTEFYGNPMRMTPRRKAKLQLNQLNRAWHKSKTSRDANRTRYGGKNLTRLPGVKSTRKR